MAVPGREIIDSRTFSQDGTKGAARRRWIVDQPGRASALQYMAENAIAYGATHPELPAFYLDRFSLDPLQDGTYQISADYSPAGVFNFESVNKQNISGQPKYVRVNFGFYDWQIEVPYGVKVQQKVMGGGNPPSTSVITVWTANRFFVPRTDLILEIEIRTLKMTYANSSYIASQVNKVHRFSTSPTYDWLFTGADLQNVSDSEDIVKYRWKRDWGSFQWGSGSGKIAYDDQGGRIALPDVARLQHCKWHMRLPDDPNAAAPNDKPVFSNIQQYDLDSTAGYASLPGLAAAITL